MNKDIKTLYFVIISYNNPNLKFGSADIKVLCKVPNGAFYWESTALDNRSNWFKFETRESAQEHIKNSGLENCIVYGIRY